MLSKAPLECEQEGVFDCNEVDRDSKGFVLLHGKQVRPEGLPFSFKEKTFVNRFLFCFERELVEFMNLIRYTAEKYSFYKLRVWFEGYLTPCEPAETLLTLPYQTEQESERAEFKEREREKEKLRGRKKAYHLGEEFT